MLARRLLVSVEERLVAGLLCDSFTSAGFDVAVAHGAAEALDVADSFDPDGAVLDVHFGDGASGLDLGRRLAAAHPAVRLVFVSRFGVHRSDDPPIGSSFVDTRAIDPARLVAVVDAALGGSATSLMLDAGGEHPIRSLTIRQLEVLRLAASGLTNEMIAHRLGSVVRSVEQRLERVYRTLGLDAVAGINPRVIATREYLAVYGPPTNRVLESVGR
jgi:DNA-binding NarL/FixJ family response regulator